MLLSGVVFVFVSVETVSASKGTAEPITTREAHTCISYNFQNRNNVNILKCEVYRDHNDECLTVVFCVLCLTKKIEVIDLNEL